MNLTFFVYRQLTTILYLILFPILKLYSSLSGRYRSRIDQHFGFYPKALKQRMIRKPRIWMHAASVGEVSVTAVIADEIVRLLPDCSLVVSTTTETGQKFAKDQLPSSTSLIYAPIDSIFAVRKALSFVVPDVLICVETEIWPNWFVEARRMGIKTILVNGRISAGSVKRYLKIASLMRETLGIVDAFSMIHKMDADRILMLGAPIQKIMINGNAKYDSLIRNYEKCNIRAIRNTYSLLGNETILVAGSTRRNEEATVLDAYEKIIQTYPETLLFLAPRHLRRTKYVADLVKERGLDFQFRSDFDGNRLKRTAPVVIIDTIGELFAVYGVGTIAFCGGSLVPLGGQNILEAAVWGKPVFYGPFMGDFQEAKVLLEDAVGDAFLVKDGYELAEKVKYYLDNPTACEQIGQRARTAVMGNQGAAEKHARVICRVLGISFADQDLLLY